jgi:hypothetical protein
MRSGNIEKRWFHRKNGGQRRETTLMGLDLEEEMISLHQNLGKPSSGYRFGKPHL